MTKRINSAIKTEDDTLRAFRITDDEVQARMVKQLKKAVKEDASFPQVLYRPFDMRCIFYYPPEIERPRIEVMQHMLAGPNLALSTTRTVEISRGFEHVLCTRQISTHHTVSMKEVNYFFPLYLYPADGSPRKPNLDAKFVAEFAGKLGLTFVEEGGSGLPPPAPPAKARGKSGAPAAGAAAKKKATPLNPPKSADRFGGRSEFGPEDIFYYIYAVFHAPTYRERYKEFLKIDFPRVPLTSNLELFSKLVPLGYELVQYHLLEHPKLDKAPVVFPEKGDNMVVKVEYNDQLRRVYINKKQWFEPVAPEVWEFHVGGYQVCNKWLKDRKERTLAFDEIRHYAKTVMALGETIRLMKEIDAAIPEWPIV
ncbi:MAG: hypothetical protein IPG71_01605 [bacterium]|nr:hypothetical protein [bacterium]